VGAGTDTEFAEFAVAAWPRLRWAAWMLCGDEHLAEDLTQTALARTYASWRRVRRDDAMAYTRKVLVNANVDRLRRRRLTEVPDTGADDTGRKVADVAGDPGDRVGDRAELTHLLAALTAQERRVLVLRYYFDLPERAVADELGVSVGTVKSTASRALSKVRRDHALPVAQPLPRGHR
jgi:RNA polymerase sigma-70 factor (sigma-E family)